MLGWTVEFQVIFKGSRPGSIGVTSVQHINQNVRTVDYFVKFFPDPLGKSFFKDGVSGFFAVLLEIILVQIDIFVGVIETLFLFDRVHQVIHTLQLKCWAFASRGWPKRIAKAGDLQESLTLR